MGCGLWSQRQLEFGMERNVTWPIQIYTVSTLTARIRQSVNSQFRDVLVEGEISNFKLYPSGHLYLTLKDDQAMIKAVVFNFYDKYHETMIEDGVAVICKGRVDVYEKGASIGCS